MREFPDGSINLVCPATPPSLTGPRETGLLPLFSSSTEKDAHYSLQPDFFYMSLLERRGFGIFLFLSKGDTIHPCVHTTWTVSYSSVPLNELLMTYGITITSSVYILSSHLFALPCAFKMLNIFGHPQGLERHLFCSFGSVPVSQNRD